MERIKKYVFITLGTMLITIGVYFFKIPNGFSTGGVSGLATVLGGVLPDVTPGMLITVINIVLLVIGFFVLGKKFAVNTAYSSLLFSFSTWALEIVLPITKPLTDQPFLELVYAILLTAFGSAMLFHTNAASGGTDVVALILKKYTNLDVGKTLLMTDFLIAASSFFVFGLRAGMFSLLGLFAKAFIVDYVIESLDMCKSFLIITTKPDEICKYIIKDMNHSATAINATGAYTGENKKVIITICRRIEAIRLKRKVNEIDEHAFVIASNTSEIIGRGFRSA